MASITASFQNGYSESRLWVVQDLGRDPNAPPILFQGYLAPGETTETFSLYSEDGVYGKAAYQRSDGAVTITDSITEGTVVSME